jgi:two-component system chemotaxis response regulator CheB
VSVRPLRVLVVDDSDASRAALVRILGTVPLLSVVGTARDGEEALREALRLLPDVVVLDLQMPRMDGFTFLRFLMARRPTPVVVVSSQAGRADVFKALELGALDFVAKPEGGTLDDLRDELAEKCETVRALRIENLSHDRLGAFGLARAARRGAPRIAVIGASTGGPQSIPLLLSMLPRDLPLGILLAQHMPAKFTSTFAERLGRVTSFSAQEAGHGDLVAEGRVLVAPGGRHLELVRDPEGALRTAVFESDVGPARHLRYCPSIDRLFISAARELGSSSCAVVLTGMGQDGREGIAAVKRVGGLTLAESAETAVIYGMPRSAAESGAVDEVLGLTGLAERLVRFAREA